jgi:hypothetical protein
LALRRTKKALGECGGQSFQGDIVFAQMRGKTGAARPGFPRDNRFEICLQAGR